MHGSINIVEASMLTVYSQVERDDAKGWILSSQLGPCSVARAEDQSSGSSSSWVVPVVVVVCVVAAVAAIGVVVAFIVVRRNRAAKIGADSKYQQMDT
jgi:hypothetical protein